MPDSAPSSASIPGARIDDPCVVCGMAALVPLKCKVICRHCGTIVQSCADLHA